MITGKNVLLRSPEMTDLQSFHKWHNNKELKKTAMINPFYVSLELESEWLKNIITSKENKNITFMIVEKSSDKVLGYCQLNKINWICKNAWFGIVIGEKDGRNKGYGREAAELMIDYGFNSLNLNKLSLEVPVINENAIELYSKLNFKKDAQLKQHFFCEGEYVDVIIMSLSNIKNH